MIQLVGIPKPFVGHQRIIQSNAIRSWARLPGTNNIYLLGEPSAREIANETGAVYLPDVPTDQYGTPLLGPALEAVPVKSDAVICYLNADIVVFPELETAIKTAKKQFTRMLMVAKRWNVDLHQELDFDHEWEVSLRGIVRERGKLFAPQAIDMFAFTRDTYGTIPPFSIGRSYWDNWMISEARRAGVAVIDATNAVTLVHQNHEYHGFKNLREIRYSPQGRRNFFLAGDKHDFIATVRDATYEFTVDRLIQPTRVRTVSVIIPHVGPMFRLRACLNGLEHQTYPRTFIETIVVINSRSEDTGSLRLDFPKVQFSVEAQPGAAAARNKGLAISSGEVIAFLDSDCVPESQWIEAGVAALNEAGGTNAFVGGAIQHVAKGKGRTLAGAFDCVTFLQQEQYIRHHGTCVSANMFLFSRLFAQVGVFDEWFPDAAGEDWDWCLRAQAAGATAHYAAEAKVRHPMLRNYKELKEKLLRVARGNALRWTKHQKERVEGPQASSQSNAGFPSWGRLCWRIRRLWGEPRLTVFERFGTPLLLAWIWPSLRKAWLRTQREASPDE